MLNTDITRMSFVATALRESDPNLMVVDFTQHEKTAKAVRDARELANPPKPLPAQVEYNRLLHRLYNLTEDAKNTDIYANNQAGNVKGIEERLDNQLKKKKTAAANGNLRGERYLEYGIGQLETELFEAKKELKRATNNSAFAARALKEFDGHPRLKELKKELAL